MSTQTYKGCQIDAISYNSLVQKMRDFFLQKNFYEVPVQPRLSILYACEDPFTISSFSWDSTIWPLPQTGQMWLEHELLSNPEYEGVFCISTSYRNEPNMVAGRHEKIFPMIEFESKGSMQELQKFEKELLEHFDMNDHCEINYEKACKIYNVDEIGHVEEGKLCNDFENAVFLKNFPQRTAPFWNMKHNKDGIFNKIDVLLFGQETIGSAERSTNVDEMRYYFETISDGAYRKKLFSLFGQERVEKELDEFLPFDFFERFGGGIGVTRFLRSLKLNNQ